MRWMNEVIRVANIMCWPFGFVVSTTYIRRMISVHSGEKEGEQCAQNDLNRIYRLEIKLNKLLSLLLLLCIDWK